MRIRTVTVDAPDESVVRASVSLSLAAAPRPRTRHPALTSNRLVWVPVDPGTAGVRQASLLTVRHVDCSRDADTVADIAVRQSQPVDGTVVDVCSTYTRR